MQRIFAVMAGALGVMLFALLTIVAASHIQTWNLKPSPGLEPYSPSAQRGREVYISNGCVYCHTQQVRDARFSDVARGWGSRSSIANDYVYDRPHLLGTMRTGPDLHNVGARLPSSVWHLLHLYQPRLVVPGSTMPPHRFLFKEVDTDDVSESERGKTLALPPSTIPDNRSVLASPEAMDLVEYLLSLERK